MSGLDDFDFTGIDKKNIQYVITCSLISVVIWTVIMFIFIWIIGNLDGPFWGPLSGLAQFIAVGLMFATSYWVHSELWGLVEEPPYGAADGINIILGVVAVVLGPGIGGLVFVFVFR